MFALTELQEAGAEHNQAREEGEQRRHLRVAMVTVLVRHQRHDGSRSDGDGLRRAENTVDEAAEKSAVQAILERTRNKSYWVMGRNVEQDMIAVFSYNTSSFYHSENIVW